MFDGPLPLLGDDPLTQGEERFREALEGAAERADWHQRTGTPVREGDE